MEVPGTNKPSTVFVEGIVGGIIAGIVAVFMCIIPIVVTLYCFKKQRNRRSLDKEELELKVGLDVKKETGN